MDVSAPRNRTFASFPRTSRSIGEFVEVLVEAGIDVLVDVRERALSRKKGFSKRAPAGEVGAASGRRVDAAADQIDELAERLVEVLVVGVAVTELEMAESVEAAAQRSGDVDPLGLGQLVRH